MGNLEDPTENQKPSDQNTTITYQSHRTFLYRMGHFI